MFMKTDSVLFSRIVYQINFEKGRANVSRNLSVIKVCHSTKKTNTNVRPSNCNSLTTYLMRSYKDVKYKSIKYQAGL
jgi:predicted metal-binding protein